MVSQKPKYCKNFERNSHWRKISMIMVWERYCNASRRPEFFLFSLFIFSFISQLMWVRLGWNFHRWFSIQKQVNWCTIDPFSLKFRTSQTLLPSRPLMGKYCHTGVLNFRFPQWEFLFMVKSFYAIEPLKKCISLSDLSYILYHF